MGELKMTGNCLKGSRPLLSFDENFSKIPHYALLKELFTQIFGVPNHHPKSQPFFDHVYTFTVLDNRIWFRNFQILTEDGGLAEIGPRFVLNPVKIFGGSFGGETLWDNSHYVSPAKVFPYFFVSFLHGNCIFVQNFQNSLFFQLRQAIKLKAGGKYNNRIEQKLARVANKPEQSYALNPTDEIFTGEALEKAEKLEELENEQVSIAVEEKKAPKKKLRKERVTKKKKKTTVVAKKVRTWVMYNCTILRKKLTIKTCLWKNWNMIFLYFLRCFTRQLFSCINSSGTAL